MPGHRIECTCKQCGKAFFTFKAWIRRGNGGKFCSRVCSDEAKKGVPSPFNRHVWLSCEGCGKSFSVKKYRIGTARFCSRECQGVVRGRTIKGKNHPSWRGGLTLRPWGVKKWAKAVKERDGWKCLECNETERGRLEAHHVEEWLSCPEKRYDIDNGQTLCLKCHLKRHPKLIGLFIKKLELQYV